MGWWPFGKRAELAAVGDEDIAPDLSEFKRQQFGHLQTPQLVTLISIASLIFVIWYFLLAFRIRWDRLALRSPEGGGGSLDEGGPDSQKNG